jgi:hypothetical protein
MSSSAKYNNVLPELLFALVGHHGGAFVEHSSGEGGTTLVLSASVDWVPAAERCGADQASHLPPVPICSQAPLTPALQTTTALSWHPHCVSGSNSIALPVWGSTMPN